MEERKKTFIVEKGKKFNIPFDGDTITNIAFKGERNGFLQITDYLEPINLSTFRQLITLNLQRFHYHQGKFQLYLLPDKDDTIEIYYVLYDSIEKRKQLMDFDNRRIGRNQHEWFMDIGFGSSQGL